MQRLSQNPSINRRMHWINNIVLLSIIARFSFVYSQPLDQQPDSFPCGPLNLTCLRWGYTACVNPDGEYYCLPCDHEYVSKLCGTKDQLQGCNLYCTQKKLDSVKEIWQQSFSKEKKEMQNNFTSTLRKERDEKYILKNQSQQYLTDMNLYSKKIKFLEVELAKRQSATIIFVWSVCACGILVVGGILLICWCMKRNKRSVDIDKTVEKALLKRNGTASISLDDCSIIDEIVDKYTQTGDIEDNISESMIDESMQDEISSSLDSSCPGKYLLQNIPPANDREGRHKLAINCQENDVLVGD